MEDKFYNMPHYLYILTNPDWKGKCKFGYTKNYQKRLLDSSEQHSALSNYRYLYQVKANANYKLHTEYDLLFSKGIRREDYITELNQLYQFQPAEQFSMLEKIRPSLINEGGGTEFIKEKGIVALTRFIESREGYQKLGLEVVKQFTSDEIAEINLKRVREFNKRQAKEDTKYESIFANIPQPIPLPQPIQPYVWNPRQYQIEIIAHSIQELRDKHKIYIELATGGGKSYIVFNILNEFRPDVIVIFSPRKKINEQNLDKRYLSLLEDKYETFNMSSEISPTPFLKKTGKKIIICCSQSAKRLHEHLTKSQYNFKDVMVWYDEAHWGFEEWKSINKKKSYEIDTDGNKIDFKKFWLEDFNIISKRIFVSASPNKEIVNNNTNIFGNLYKHIKVRDLIVKGWICDIKVNIFDFEIKKENVNICNSVIEAFVTNNKNWGFSFHNSQKSAFNLFYEHYKLYLSGETKNKPFLLISEKYENLTDKKVNEDEELQYIRDKSNKIRLEYDYRDEIVYQDNIKSIAYVVKKFSMGYDFEGIDYIIFTDRKTAYKDIIQSIGRGLRSDKKKKTPEGNRLNECKELHIDLPIYFEGVETDDKYEYKQLIEVLGFLINDLEIEWSDILKKQHKKKKIINRYVKGIKYDGNELVRQKILNILDRIKAIKSYPKFIEILQEYNIYGSVEYNRFITDNINLGLPKNPAIKYKEQQFCWYQVLSNEEKKKYYNSQDCIQRIIEIRDELEEEDNDYLDEEDDFDEKLNFLNEKDNKIPNRNIWEFYGMEQKKFVVF